MTEALQDRNIRTSRALARGVRREAGSDDVSNFVTAALEAIVKESIGLQRTECAKGRNEWYTTTVAAEKQEFRGSQQVANHLQTIRLQLQQKRIPLPQVSGTPPEAPYQPRPDEYTLGFSISSRVWNKVEQLSEYFQMNTIDVCLQALERHVARSLNAKTEKSETSFTNTSRLATVVSRDNERRELNGKAASNKGYEFAHQEINHERSLVDNGK